MEEGVCIATYAAPEDQAFYSFCSESSSGKGIIKNGGGTHVYLWLIHVGIWPGLDPWVGKITWRRA